MQVVQNVAARLWPDIGLRDHILTIYSAEENVVASLIVLVLTFECPEWFWALDIGRKPLLMYAVHMVS